MRDHLVAVDIGTASARAGLFDRSGTLIAKATHPIILHRPNARIAEHDSADIWNAACASVREALATSGIDATRIAAIGFDATCSLVVTRKDGGPASVSASATPGLDTISWMDHRALEEATELTALGGPVVARCGGSLSPEMALPKLLWLKRHLPSLWIASCGIFDLADYLTCRATGSTVRSLSTLGSKWGIDPREPEGWPQGFLEKAGLQDLPDKAGMTSRPSLPGSCIGYLSPNASQELGLDTGCRVAAGMVDAYAGALGLLGAVPPKDIAAHAALVAGTSSCMISFCREEAKPQKSFWGPFENVSYPGLWLREGGQSAAGSLLDHIVRMHAAGGEPDATLHDRILRHVEAERARTGEGYGLPIQVLPDFHGNRAPLADPFASGVIAGLSLDTSFDSLCRLYWRAAVGLACSLRHILDVFGEAGVRPEMVHMAGGHARTPLLAQLYADVLGLPVLVPEMGEAILLGTAINAATAGGLYQGMTAAASAMTGKTRRYSPDPARSTFHAEDYRRHLMMVRHREELFT